MFGGILPREPGAVVGRQSESSVSAVGSGFPYFDDHKTENSSRLQGKRDADDQLSKAQVQRA